MNLKFLYLFLIILLGEIIIIVGFNRFGTGVNSDILMSDIIVSSVIFCAIALEFTNPIVNLRDETQAAIGGIGIRWVFMFVFIAGSIGVMVYSFKNKEVDITLFWLLQAVLILILLLGLYFSRNVTEKVSEVYHEEKKLRSQLIEIKACIEELKFVGLDSGNLQQEEHQMLNELLDNLRYLAPSNNPKATELEASILNELNVLKDSLSLKSQGTNLKLILNRCDLLYKQRKQLYSN